MIKIPQDNHKVSKTYHKHTTRYHKIPQAPGMKYLLLIIIISMVVLNITFMVGAGEYDPVLYLVDADSNVDGVDNWASDDFPYGLGDGDYNLTREKDSSSQVIRDYAGTLGAHNYTTRNETFDNPSDFVYDSDLVNVSNGEAKLTSHPVAHERHAQWNLEDGTGYGTGSNYTLDEVSGLNGTLETGESTLPIWTPCGLDGIDYQITLQSAAKSYINFSSNIGSSLGDWEYNDTFSVAAWIYPTVYGNWQFYYQKETAGIRGWAMMSSFGRFKFSISNTWSPNYRIVMQGNVGWASYQWHHVVVSYNGNGDASGFTYYENSVDSPFVAVQNSLGNRTIRNNQPVTTSARATTNFWSDFVTSQFVMFDHVVNQSEVDWLYNGGDGTTEPYGMGYYNGTSQNATVFTTVPVQYDSAPVMFTHNVSIPSTCAIRYQVSNDNGSTWYYWDTNPFVKWTPSTHNTYNETSSGLDLFLYMSEWQFQRAQGGNWSLKIWLNSTNQGHTPILYDYAWYLGLWSLTWEHQFQNVAAAEKHNFSIYYYDYSFAYPDTSEDLFIQYWTGSTWVNATLNGEEQYFNGSQSWHWQNVTVDNLEVVGNNITIRWCQKYFSEAQIQYHMNYIEMVAWFSDGYGSPIFTSWSNSSINTPVFVDVVLFAIVLDVDNTSTEIAITIYYSNDSFASDNNSLDMVYSNSPSADHYNFTYTWAGENNTEYQFYYVCNDSIFSVGKFNPTAGSYFTISWLSALTPAIVAWFDSTLLIDPYANVLFDCTVYDLDSNGTQLNVTIFYSIDGFALDNRSVNMTFATETSPDHYKFTYLWAGEAAGVFYQYYYQANDSYFTVRKPANYESGILFDIQWDLVIISPAGDFIGGWVEAARKLIEPNNRWLYWLLLLSLALSSFAVIKRNKNKRY